MAHPVDPKKVPASKGDAYFYVGEFVPIDGKLRHEDKTYPGKTDSETWKKVVKGGVEAGVQNLNLADDTLPVGFDKLSHVTDFNATINIFYAGIKAGDEKETEIKDEKVTFSGTWWHPVVSDEKARGLKDYHLGQIKQTYKDLDPKKMEADMENAQVFTSSPVFDNKKSRYGNYR